MTHRSADRAISMNDALCIAEELVSTPGNHNLVVWLQPTRGGVTLRQQSLARPVQASRPQPRPVVKPPGLFQRWFGN